MDALGLDTADLEGALRALEERDPRIAVLLEPMLGVTLHADDGLAPRRRST